MEATRTRNEKAHRLLNQPMSLPAQRLQKRYDGGVQVPLHGPE